MRRGEVCWLPAYKNICKLLSRWFLRRSTRKVCVLIQQLQQTALALEGEQPQDLQQSCVPSLLEYSLKYRVVVKGDRQIVLILHQPVEHGDYLVRGTVQVDRADVASLQCKGDRVQDV